MLGPCDYAEKVVFSFSHKIKSAYYGGCRSVSIEGVVLEHFHALPQIEIKPSKHHVHEIQCFIHFCWTRTNKMLPLLRHTSIVWFNCLKNKKTDVNIKYNMGNTDGCTEQYRCASALYLMSVLSQRHSIIIDWVIIAPGHGN